MKQRILKVKAMKQKILKVLNSCIEDGMCVETLDDIADQIMSAIVGSAQAGSVLQDWVMQLPLREQGTLLTAVRGCDLTPKLPLDSTERKLVGSIRAAFMNPADPREVDREPGCFFISCPPNPAEFRFSELGHYPLHWVSHVMHAMEIIAYRHPVAATRDQWSALYHRLVHSLHLNPESKEQMVNRLGEDRIASGTVVS